MTKAEGKSRIDAVTVVEMSLTLVDRSRNLQAKYMLSNSTTGDRYGSGTFDTWNDDTIAAFQAMMKLMERDICSVVFDKPVTTNSVEEPNPTPPDEVPSL